MPEEYFEILLSQSVEIPCKSGTCKVTGIESHDRILNFSSLSVPVNAVLLVAIYVNDQSLMREKSQGWAIKKKEKVGKCIVAIVRVALKS